MDRQGERGRHGRNCINGRYCLLMRHYVQHDTDFDKLLATDANGKRLISNSKLYQLAGNSIVTDCMVAMFENLFCPSGQHHADKQGQLSLF